MKGKHSIHFLIPRLGITDRGAEVFVYELAKRLGGDYEITIWARKTKNKSVLTKDLEKKGVTVKQVWCVTSENKLTQALYGLSFLKGFLDTFRLNPIELEMLTFSISVFPRLLLGKQTILFPVNGVWGVIACRILRALKGIPFVYSSQGGIDPLIAKQKPDIYFAINPKIKSWFNKHFPKLKIPLIPNGVDINKFKPGTKPASLKLENPVFLCVAALIPNKSVDLSIKAVSKLKRGSLLIIGEGALKAELENLGNKLLGKKRFLIKKVPYMDIPSHYTASDMFTLASAKEPFGIVYLEAMASGIPVVATDDESRRYIVGQGGILCKTAIISEYAKALDKAVKTDFDVKPRNQATKFSWEIISKKYSKAINEIVNS